MATLARTSLPINGNINFGAADGQAVAVAAQDQVVNIDGRTFLYISNQNAGTDTVTILVQNPNQFTAAGVPIVVPNLVVALATTERRIIGPLSPSVYNDSGGNIQITHSVTATVKVFAFALAAGF